MPYLAQFKNEEFKISFEHVCSQLEGEEFTVEDVQKAYQNAVACISELEILRPDKGPHPLTRSITDNRDLRFKSLQSMKGRVTSFLKSPVQEEQEAAQLIMTWLNRFKKNYHKPSIHKQTEMVNNMSKDLSQDQAIGEALVVLGLVETFDHIRTTTASIVRNVAAREIEERAEVLKSIKVRQNAYDKMKMLRTTIETAIKLEKGDIDKHYEYLRTINFALTDFKTLHLSDNTRRLNAALEAEEENNSSSPVNEDQINSSVNTKTTTSRSNLISMSEEMGENNQFSTHDVAMQSSTTKGDVVEVIPVDSDVEQDTAVKPDVVDSEHQFKADDSSDHESKMKD